MPVLWLLIMPKDLDFTGAVEQVTTQEVFRNHLSTLTKFSTRLVIMGSCTTKYAPARTGGSAPGHPLAATK